MAFDVQYIQVRDKETGLEYPVPLERYRLAPDLWDKVDEDPRDPQTGAILSAKPRTDVDTAAKSSKSRGGRKRAATQSTSTGESGDDASTESGQSAATTGGDS